MDADRISPALSLRESSTRPSVRVLIKAPRGRRLFRYRLDDEIYNLTARRLNDYIGEFLGDEFTAKDFRTGEGRSSQRSGWPSVARLRR
jgi:DNA topoisomerase IB